MLTFVTAVAPYHLDRVAGAAASVAAQTVPCQHVIVTDEDMRGAGYARNVGLTQVATPFVAFLDADDCVAPDFAARTLAAYAALDTPRYIYTDWLADTRVNAPDCAWTGGTWHVVTALLPTAWAIAVGGFDTALEAAEDTDFYCKLTAHGYCGARLAEPLFTYGDGGKRSAALLASGRRDAVLAQIHQRYRGLPMACCGRDEPTVITGDVRQEGDVLARALWRGNRVVMGRVTGRHYPRTSFPNTVWVNPQDIQADAASWALVAPEPVNAPRREDVLAFLQESVGDA